MNTFFKKSLMSTAFVFLSAGAMAEEISGDFTWTGFRDLDEASIASFCIKVSDIIGSGLAPDAGKLTFAINEADKTKVDIASSSELGFTVVARNSQTNACDGEKISFKYKLISTNFSMFPVDNGLSYTDIIKNLYKLEFWHRIVTSESDVSNVLVSSDDNYAPAGTDVSFWVKGEQLMFGDTEVERAVTVTIGVLIERDIV